jgi:hypothetical protein
LIYFLRLEIFKKPIDEFSGSQYQSNIYLKRDYTNYLTGSEVLGGASFSGYSPFPHILIIDYREKFET